MRVDEVWTPIQTGRTLLGILLKDWRRYQRALCADGQHYLTLCNRYERLEAAPDGSGFRCNWRWTSELLAPRHLPSLGLTLMRRALADHPIRRQSRPPPQPQAPDISFLIGHRGVERLPQLLATMESIAGQRDVGCDCIVVEQDHEVRLTGHLPDWVRHIHTPPPAPDLPYCRAWAFNVGARLAKGRLLVLHDNDMLVPTDYATRLLDLHRQGWEVINLKRFIFYLSEGHSQQILAGQAGLTKQAPQAIMQNAEGGGSIAISRSGYQRIGGLDEGFIGWGGEDNEFWERCQTLRVWPYGSLPFLHLWHPNQPGKYEENNPAIQRFQTLSKMSVEQRIARLRRLDQGKTSGPHGWNCARDTR